MRKSAGAKAKSREDRGGGPRRLGTVVSQLMSRRGYAAVAAQHAMTDSVVASVGSLLAESFRIGKLNRGVLEVYVVDSVTMQEFTFQKRTILKRLAKDHPQTKITDLRFRIQSQMG